MLVILHIVVAGIQAGFIAALWGQPSVAIPTAGFVMAVAFAAVQIIREGREQ